MGSAGVRFMTTSSAGEVPVRILVSIIGLTGFLSAALMTGAVPIAADKPDDSPERLLEQIRKPQFDPGRTVEVTNLTFEGQIREGRLKKSPFTATVGKVPFEGGISLDLRGQVPVATLDIRSENADVGSLLGDLQIVENSGLKARRLRARPQPSRPVKKPRTRLKIR